ncbi:hypothetical protein CEC48_06470 [Pseudomonas sp. K2I15]|nr:hypothetical protein CEC48_06470 [Pseudomonas sp. K2I15]
MLLNLLTLPLQLMGLANGFGRHHSNRNPDVNITINNDNNNLNSNAISVTSQSHASRPIRY